MGHALPEGYPGPRLGTVVQQVCGHNRRTMARKVQPPADVRAALEELLGQSVAGVQVVEHSWFARAHLRAVATTRPRRIYLRGSASEFFDDPVLTLHEYCHVICQWQSGRLTVSRYVLEWFRRGYWDNRFEIEAREFAADNVYRYRALLARHGAALSR
jgi:hypothetical protein